MFGGERMHNPKRECILSPGAHVGNDYDMIRVDGHCSQSLIKLRGKSSGPWSIRSRLNELTVAVVH